MVQSQFAYVFPIVIGDTGCQCGQDIGEVVAGGLYRYRLGHSLGVQIGLLLLGGIGPGVGETIVVKGRLLQSVWVNIRRENIGLDQALLPIQVFHHQFLRHFGGKGAGHQRQGKQQAQRQMSDMLHNRPLLLYRFCLMMRVMMPMATPCSSSIRVTAKLTSSFLPG